jgi:adenosylcobinamide-GDP ribazoletransferase
MTWRDAVALATGTLSVLPAGVPRTVDRVVAGRAMALAPAVAVPIGAAAAVVTGVADQLRPDAHLLSAVLGVATVVAVSGALHLDGLADTADGLGSRRGRDAMLAIMRQGDVGPFGVATVVLVLLIDVAALTACLGSGIGWQAILVATVASRAVLPWACRRGVPSARPDGLGATVAGSVRPWTAVVAVLLAAAGAAALLQPHGPRPAAVAAGAVLLAVAAGDLVVRRCVRALGGVTGDVLGAAVETGLAAALLLLALLT